MKTIKQITFVGVIAGLYTALTLIFAPISYSYIQVRIAEALTVLPFLTPLAIPALFIGVFLANLFGGFGPWDWFGGSFLSLLAAVLTWLSRKLRRPWLAPVPPILLNAFGVSLYLQYMVEGFVPGLKTYLFFVVTIGIGEIIACLGLGYPLLRYLMRTNLLTRFGFAEGSGKVPDRIGETKD